MFDPQVGRQPECAEQLGVKGDLRRAENVAMPMHAPSPEPELTHDERTMMNPDAETDPWSSGYIVFSLGPNFDEASPDWE